MGGQNASLIKPFFSFSSKGSNCLRHRANRSSLLLPTQYPGVAFTADEQCKQQYGKRAGHCRKYKVLEKLEHIYLETSELKDKVPGGGEGGNGDVPVAVDGVAFSRLD